MCKNFSYNCFDDFILINNRHKLYIHKKDQKYVIKSDLITQLVNKTVTNKNNEVTNCIINNNDVTNCITNKNNNDNNNEVTNCIINNNEVTNCITNKNNNDNNNELITCIDQIRNILENYNSTDLQIVGLPDMHLGYSFPIGTVVAMPLETAQIAPEGVGFDINCGVRCLITNLSYKDVKPFLIPLSQSLYSANSAGQQKTKFIPSISLMKSILNEGIKGLYSSSNLLKLPMLYESFSGYDQYVEDSGSIKGDFKLLSQKQIGKGIKMLGTLGSGNHYLEVQRIEEIYDVEEKRLKKDQIVIFIHCGSRGLGQDVCSSFLSKSLFHDLTSETGKKYFDSMNTAANYAYANREVISMIVKKVFQSFFPSVKIDILYDCGHNVAKIEQIDGIDYLVHRKGASRAFPGQYVAVGGSMATNSYILKGLDSKKTFYSACHGSGRLIPRKLANKILSYEQIVEDMKKKEIILMCDTKTGVVEEAGECYKSIDEVVEHCEKMRITKTVSKNVPLIVIKG
ncbi:hypothetical protein NUSPORA_00506 [Nucleospora cyclopteri]